jgi:RNA recognition motif-containing protein
MNIYCGNLPYGVSENELRDLFSGFGEVSSVAIITDKYTGQSKGFGFIEMPNQDEAQKAIEALHENDLQGRNITVNQARPREDRPRDDRSSRDRY